MLYIVLEDGDCGISHYLARSFVVCVFVGEGLASIAVELYPSLQGLEQCVQRAERPAPAANLSPSGGSPVRCPEGVISTNG
jgi:hypothetical protein